MNNARIYNGAYVGAMTGMATNRIDAISAATVATCVAFATAVDNAISPIPGGATSGQQELISEICRSAMTNAYSSSIPTTVVTNVVAKYTLATASLVAEPSSTATSRYYARNVVTQVIDDTLILEIGVNSDGVTNVEGDVIISAGPCLASERHLRGPYVVGAVAGGFAPLTRPSWYTGTVSTGGQLCTVTEGTVYNGSQWNSFHIGSTFVAGVDNVSYMPYAVATQVGLFNGSRSVLLPVLSHKSAIAVVRNVANFAGIRNTIDYDVTLTGGGGNDGIGYDTTVTINGRDTNTTVNDDDSSTVMVTLTNQAIVP
jgi:hypothetical protein